jgi:nitrite reductase/ring-hydroxylating ferredoxin subunit
MHTLRSLLRSTTIIGQSSKQHYIRSFTTSSLLAMPVQKVKVASASEAPRSGSHKAFVFAGKGDDEVSVLVTNIEGKLYATSAKCTHYGAPLANGVLTAKGSIICPWHGACFNAKTGDVEDAPALDNLLKLNVETDSEGNVFVEADAEKLKGKPGQAPGCAKAVQSGSKGTIIVGGGSAAINCAESARKVSRDTSVKYDVVSPTDV